MTTKTGTEKVRGRGKIKPGHIGMDGKTGLKLDLGAGQNCREGFTGVDLWDGADVRHDLTDFPWPFEDESVDEVHSSHYVEHTLPVGGQNDGLIAFVNEVWRILKPEGTVTIIHPYLQSDRAFQDPTHTRFIPHMTWWYFNAEWRKANGLDHYPIVSDFTVANIQSQLGVDALGRPWQLRPPETQQFATRHYWNVIGDLVVTLKKPDA